MNQVSISESVAVTGREMVGGRTTTVRFHPAQDDTGYQFYSKGKYVSANLTTAKPLRMGWLSLIAVEQNGIRVFGVEHPLSALYGLDIDNVIIELAPQFNLRGIQFPTMDNGVKEIVEKLAPKRRQGTRPKQYRALRGEEETIPCRGKRGLEMLVVESAEGLQVEYTIAYPHAAISEQDYTFTFSEDQYRKELMRARSPVWLPFGSREIMQLLSPLHGATDQNALLVGSRWSPTYRNSRTFSYGKDELIRHKILDTLGELALTGVRYVDTLFRFYRAGHGFKLYALGELQRRNAFAECDAPVQTEAVPIGVTSQTTRTAHSPTAASSHRR